MNPWAQAPSWTTGPSVVALGGGHGLAASLRALRRVTDSVTAVVGVSDDGGSSGRIRRELGLMPPGDLRMALAALCGDDTWGRTWSRVLQHRFEGGGELAGHAVGNLLISALWEETDDVVAGLDWVAALLKAQGRVLPVACEPVDLIAQVRGLGGRDVVTTLRGQVDIATTAGEVLSLQIDPPDPLPCEPVLEAIGSAEMVVLGPGSWFTSVLPHLYVGPVHDAIVATAATRVLVVNVAPQEGETSGFTPAMYLRSLAGTFPDIRLDAVIVDPTSVHDEQLLRAACADLGAETVIEEVRQSGAVHDALLLASVFQRLLG
ncbi:MAG: YvcK family protein [Candidatus Nanopelagicales bacterium]